MQRPLWPPFNLQSPPDFRPNVSNKSPDNHILLGNHSLHPQRQETERSYAEADIIDIIVLCVSGNSLESLLVLPIQIWIHA
jgi:hypothetical protein